LVEYVWGSFLEVNGAQSNTKVSIVPILGKVVSVVEEAITGPDSNHISAFEVLGHVVLNWAHVHVRVMSEDWGLGKLLSAKKHIERVAAVIGLVDFFNFDGLIA